MLDARIAGRYFVRMSRVAIKPKLIRRACERSGQVLRALAERSSKQATFREQKRRLEVGIT